MSSRRLNREDELTLGLTVNLKFNKSKRLSITNRCLGNEPPPPPPTERAPEIEPMCNAEEAKRLNPKGVFGCKLKDALVPFILVRVH